MSAAPTTAPFVLKRPYAPTPFWFLNDMLVEEELVRQIKRMDEVGVGGFVMHPRMGLPRSQGWMSAELLRMMRVCCEEAKRRGLRVVLYDEGMYPSGSSAGQVVAENPAYATRCIQAREGEELREGETLLLRQRLKDGRVFSYVDRPLPSVIRGLHYEDEATGKEETPPAADLLNPAAMASFFRHVHEKYKAALGDLFSASGGPITGIFTDEPSLLGRPLLKNVMPGTGDMLAHAKRLTGTDFAPLLPALFFDDEEGPDHAKEVRAQWWKACRMRMEETYYRPMREWCDQVGLELMGHPELPGDIALERYLSVPGQDCVWRWNLPGPTATQGAQSTNPKCASSAAAHLGRKRNSNEFLGAYGHELTFDEMKWLADYLLVRGQNWLIPHAYYYSVRGPRFDERPPDVGLNSKWADRVGRFNGYIERLSQLVAEGEQVVRVAVLGSGDELPWMVAEVLYQNQIDFNYLEDHLFESGAAKVDQSGVSIARFHYDILIYDGFGHLGAWSEPLKKGGHLVDASQEGWLAQVLMLAPRTLEVTGTGTTGLRVRRMRRGGGGGEMVLVFNETTEPAEFQAKGVTKGNDPWAGQEAGVAPVKLPGFGVVVLE